METKHLLDKSVFGGHASREDYRTLKSDMFAKGDVLPPKKKIVLDFTAVNELCDQQSLGVCTKCACRMAEEEFWRDGIRLSEYWGYLMGKVLIDDVTYGIHFEGSSALTMLKTANKYGTPTKAMEKKYPLKTDGSYREFIDDFKSKYGGKIPDEVLEDAKKHKIPGYYAVTVDPVAIAREIANGRLLVVRMAVGDNFYRKPSGEITWNRADLLPLRVPKSVDSGHLMAMNEYDGLSPLQKLSGPNSWSKEWCKDLIDIENSGYYNFVFNVQAPYYFTEAWAISEIPPEVIKNVRDLPEAKSFHHLFQKNIERGDSGDEVRSLQIALCILGFLDIRVDELGTYGPKTAKGVLSYQKARKLLPDAQLEANGGDHVRSLTIGALNKDINK